MKLQRFIGLLVVNWLISAAICAPVKDEVINFDNQLVPARQGSIIDKVKNIGNQEFSNIGKRSPWDVARNKLQEFVDFVRKGGADMWNRIRNVVKKFFNIP